MKTSKDKQTILVDSVAFHNGYGEPFYFLKSIKKTKRKLQPMTVLQFHRKYIWCNL